LRIPGNGEIAPPARPYTLSATRDTLLLMSSIATPDWSTLPAPEDDGAARHLPGLRMPSIALAATDGASVDLSTLPGITVVFAYPRTGVPGEPNPDGWEAIPGARGCTPQTCAFRDHFAELRSLGVGQLYGLSTQSTAYQRELAERLHLPFPILSDEALALTRALRLPTFTTQGMTLLKRLTLILRDGLIEHVFYPVFPPDRNAADVLAWLSTHANPQTR
jgi:peroxiredoxin